MIYEKNGDALSVAYEVDSDELENAYAKDGTVIYSKEPPTPQTQLKVMEYNCGQWYIGTSSNVPAELDSAYYALQNGMIQNADADVLLLCEYRDQFSQLPRTALSMLEQYYPYNVNYGGSSAYMGRAIYSKYPITNYTRHEYEDVASTMLNYYDSCTIEIDGKPITFVVTHLSSASRRYNQLSELITFLSGLTGTFICAGDINTLYCSDAEGTDYTNMIVPLLQAGFTLANCAGFGFKVTYSDEPTDGTYTGCLDNIICSDDITIKSVTVDTTKETDSIVEKIDHMPLIAVLEL